MGRANSVSPVYDHVLLQIFDLDEEPGRKASFNTPGENHAVVAHVEGNALGQCFLQVDPDTNFCAFFKDNRFGVSWAVRGEMDVEPGVLSASRL